MLMGVKGSQYGMVKLIVNSGPLQGLELKLHRGSNFVGRAPGNDFQLNEESVSHRHCEIQVTEFSVRVRDLGSTNGTFIDAEPVTEAEIKAGQTLTVGEVELSLDGEVARVAIPEIQKHQHLTAQTLEDGRPACLVHPTEAAVRECTRCRRAFCLDCVHQLRFVGGRIHYLCPECSGETVALGPEGEERESIFTRVWNSIRGSFRRGFPGRNPTTRISRSSHRRRRK